VGTGVAAYCATPVFLYVRPRHREFDPDRLF
jgi:hypothetical protein